MKKYLLSKLILICVLSCHCGQNKQQPSLNDTANTTDKSKLLMDTLSKNPVLFLKVASKQFGWEEPVEPVKIGGQLYFVGTEGLSSFLITTSKGNILLYTGMPSSGPMIEENIKKLGFKPEEIKYILTGHAHSDHAGGHAYIKKISGGDIVIMDEEKDLLESGGKLDFHYGNYPEFFFEPVKADKVIRNGDTLTLGEVNIVALHTPGHTKGGTTWVMNIEEGGKTFNVVFPDGTSINPGYRVEVDPSYEGIGDNYRKTLGILQNLSPDIWLSSHTDFFDFESKRKLADAEGIDAWVDQDGYKKRITDEREKFEAQVEFEKAESHVAK